MRGDMVGAGLHAEFDALSPGVPHKTCREARGLARRRTPWRTHRLEVAAIALINLNNWLDRWIAIAPVCAHAGCGGMRAADAVEFVEVGEQYFPCILFAGLFFCGNFEHRPPAHAEQHVAMTVRPPHATLIRIERRKAVSNGVEIHRLLQAPPVVRNRLSGLVVAYAEVIESRRIHRITVTVVERAVAISVPGNIGVPMNVAARDAPGSIAQHDAIGSYAFDITRFLRMGWRQFAGRRAKRYQCGRRCRFALGQKSELEILLLGSASWPDASIRHPDSGQIAASPPHNGRRQIDAAPAFGKFDYRRPPAVAIRRRLKAP